METLAYSFHLGSDGNKSKRAKSKSKNNLSGTTSYANNGIQNSQQHLKLIITILENMMVIQNTFINFVELEMLYMMLRISI